jgi:hypothetical protein
VVVGNDGGHRFCEELAERNTENRFHITCIGEEPRPAYDRVHLSDFFSGKTAKDLQLADTAWYSEHGIELCLGDRVIAIDRDDQAFSRHRTVASATTCWCWPPGPRRSCRRWWRRSAGVLSSHRKIQHPFVRRTKRAAVIGALWVSKPPKPSHMQSRRRRRVARVSARQGQWRREILRV